MQPAIRRASNPTIPSPLPSLTLRFGVGDTFKVRGSCPDVCLRLAVIGSPGRAIDSAHPLGSGSIPNRRPDG
jgi:hypothetical protein